MLLDDRIVAQSAPIVVTVCFLILLGLKFWGFFSNAPGYNGQIAILDWIFDLLLELSWYGIFAWQAGHHAAVIVAGMMMLMTYPFSEE